MLDRSALNVAIRPAFSAVENRFVTRFAENIAGAGYNVVELSWNPVSVIKYDFIILHWPEDFFCVGSAKETISALAKLMLLTIGRVWRGTRLIWVAHNARPHDGGDKVSSLADVF